MNDTPWSFMARVVLKALLLFLLCNILYLVTQPAEYLGKLSLYNGVWPGRERLPYGENPAADYNVSLNNIPAMLASHLVSESDDEAYRVFVIGDSSVWGWLLTNEETLTARLNAAQSLAADGRPMVFYNLGYPIIAVSKDLLLLEAALAYEPDLIIWLTTLEALPRDKQGVPPIVIENPERRAALAGRYGVDFGLQTADAQLWQRTLISQRRPLADLLRLQLYGGSWRATGIDQAIPDDFELRSEDFSTDVSWQGADAAARLPSEILAFDMIAAGFALAGEVPILLVNEPIFISQGENSDLRYNAFYPRWAYDWYRTVLRDEAAAQGWPLLDLWDVVPAAEFTDSPVHLTPAGTAQLAGKINAYLEETDVD